MFPIRLDSENVTPETPDPWTPWIQQIDLARLFILHEYGGIYHDLDIIPNCTMPAMINEGSWRPKISIARTSNRNGATFSQKRPTVFGDTAYSMMQE